MGCASSRLREEDPSLRCHGSLVGRADSAKRSHPIRHTAKQQLQEAGAPEFRISDLLGHAGQGVTHGTYGEAAQVKRMA
jgi:integrase